MCACIVTNTPSTHLVTCSDEEEVRHLQSSGPTARVLGVPPCPLLRPRTPGTPALARTSKGMLQQFKPINAQITIQNLHWRVSHRGSCEGPFRLLSGVKRLVAEERSKVRLHHA